jgi:hypothetical protein
MPRYDALPVNLPSRGLQQEAAAQYIGISVGKFDEAKEERAHRTVWKRRADLIKAIQGIHGEISSEIDQIIGSVDASLRVAVLSAWSTPLELASNR